MSQESGSAPLHPKQIDLRCGNQSEIEIDQKKWKKNFIFTFFTHIDGIHFVQITEIHSRATILKSAIEHSWDQWGGRYKTFRSIAYASFFHGFDHVNDRDIDVYTIRVIYHKAKERHVPQNGSCVYRLLSTGRFDCGDRTESRRQKVRFDFFADFLLQKIIQRQ